MKGKAALVVVGLLAIVLVGCAGKTIPGATVEKGVVTFSADGVGVATEDTPLALEEARLAAAVDAKANLLGKIKGEIVAGKASVEGLQFASQEAEAMVHGFLARVTITYLAAPATNVPPAAPAVVTATATLKMSEKEYKQLKSYAE
jgi:hypothetical protein